MSINDTRVEVASEITFSGLLNLIERKTLALRIPNYYPVTDAKRVSEQIIKGYRTEGVGGAIRFGMPFYDTDKSPELLAQYYSQAIQVQRYLRQIFSPCLSPIDKLRLELQEVWTAGVLAENLDGRNLFVGLGRVFKDGIEGLPHQDVLRRQTPEQKALSIKAQLGSNLYLQRSTSGGDLEVWDLYLTDEEHQKLRTPGSYGIERSKLPLPTVVIQPEIGELILFNSESVHGVRAIAGETRVSVSSFICYRGIDQPLTMYS